MRKIALSFAILGLTAGAAFAQMETPFAEIDTDASGEVTFEELQVIVPDATQEAFDAADTDTSGGLSSEEVEAMMASMAPEAATTAPAAPAAQSPATTTPAPTDAPVATDLDSGSTSSSESDNMGGDAGAGN